jgi:hypothetical protein
MTRKILIEGLLWIMLLWTTFVPRNTYARWFGDMIGVDGIHTVWTEKKQEDSLIHTIQTAINRVLGLLSMVTLCFVLYAGFLMLTSWWDSKKYDSWLSIIKNAAIWLAIIAVSWLIVSLIFYVINGSVWWNVK